MIYTHVLEPGALGVASVGGRDCHRCGGHALRAGTGFMSVLRARIREWWGTRGVERL